MIKYFTFSLMLFFATSAFSQPNQTEAKAAYLLAEESYGKGDYKTALDFLKQVKTIMGKSNCKILYLEIMATRELFPKIEDGDKLIALIDEFEKSPDYENFAEEKVLEIAKLELTLKVNMKVFKEKKDKENAVNAALEKAFNDVHNRLGPWNVSLVGLDSLAPMLKVQEWKRLEGFTTYVAPGFHYDPKNGKRTSFNWSIDEGVSYQGKIMNVGVFNGRINKYETFLVYNADKNNGDKAFQKSLEIVKEYTQKLGFAPAVTSRSLYAAYEWKRGERSILLQIIYEIRNNGNINTVQLIESLY
jgi:hypothetical protein